MKIEPQQLLSLAKEYGTPLFVYDADKIKRQISKLKEYFNTPNFHIHYAMKALSNSNILKLIHREGCGLDTVSLEEMQIALRCGVPAKDINFTPSGAEKEEYLFAIKNGIGLHVDNIEMIEYISSVRPDAEIILRYNPRIRAGGHKQLQVGDEDSKFGLSRSEAARLDGVIQQTQLKVVGVHVHVGSDIKSAENFIDAFKFLLTKGANWVEHLRYLNFGGGFKLAYNSGDFATNMEVLGKEVVRLFEKFQEKYQKKLQLIMEPGKFLVGQAGIFLTTTTTVKSYHGRKIAFVNSGFNHLIRPMYYGAFHQITNLSNPDGEIMVHDVVGYLCETDNFALEREMPSISPGDILAFHNAGAYCYMMASNYNSRVKPAEVLIEGGKQYLIRREETLEDLLVTEILIER